eukprot:1155215-Pelagomonas_calceolata.AAC.4
MHWIQAKGIPSAQILTGPGPAAQSCPRSQPPEPPWPYAMPELLCKWHDRKQDMHLPQLRGSWCTSPEPLVLMWTHSLYIAQLSETCGAIRTRD